MSSPDSTWRCQAQLYPQAQESHLRVRVMPSGTGNFSQRTGGETRPAGEQGVATTTKQNTPWRGHEAANNLGLRGLGLVEKSEVEGPQGC